MKITSLHANALNEAQSLKKQEQAAQGFEALLARKLGQAQGATPEMNVGTDALRGLVPGLATVAAGQNPEELARSATLALQEAAVRIDSLFNEVDEYADQLQQPGGDLRSAYAGLQALVANVAGLKAAYPGLDASSPELAAMVNELDVLTTTEMFKFNRGDYL
jgi:hypothetical protein